MVILVGDEDKTKYSETKHTENLYMALPHSNGKMHQGIKEAD